MSSRPTRSKRVGSTKTHCYRDAFKVAALLLIVSSIFTPLAAAFAQGSTTGSANPSSAETSDASSLSTNKNNPDGASASPLPTPPPSGGGAGKGSQGGGGIQNKKIPILGIKPPEQQEVANPQPVAYTSFSQDRLKVDQNTGALDTTFPIDIPPGRNGLQPNVDLVYNSQDTQFGSIVGEGWSINVPYIERLNKGGIDNLYATSSLNYFTSSIDGEIVSTSTVTSTGATYVARTENGAFNKYSFSNNQWTVTDKNGTQYVYGSTADSQQSDPNNASDTYKWMLKTVTDTNGNTVTYNYFKDSGQIYPSSTIYTGNSSSTGIFEVDFVRATSTDNGTSSLTGFAVNTNYRVSEIDAKVNGTWVRKYALGYTTGDNGSTTLLSSIVESGQNSSGTIINVPTTTFSYQLQTAGWTNSSTWYPPVPLAGYGGTNNGVVSADVNSDALADIISAFTDSGGTTSYGGYVDTSDGWVSSSTWDPPVSFSDFGEDTGCRVADVNGDGLPDILCGFINGSGFQSSAYINTGSGWVAATRRISPI
jgi:hypothetical protein